MNLEELNLNTNIKKCNKIKKKCGYCKKEGHNFNECNSTELNNIYNIFNKELNENIIFNINFYIKIIYFMYEYYKDINYKYLYLHPINNCIKYNLEKIINKRNILEKKAISKMNSLPTSYHKNKIKNQLIDEYFNIFINNFIKKEGYLKIIFDTDFNFDNLYLFLTNIETYGSFDILIIIILLIKIFDIDVNFLINYFFECFNKIISIEENKDKINLVNNHLYKGIIDSIDVLLDLGYEFEKENKFYKKIIYCELMVKKDIDENDNKIDKEIHLCPICYENYNENEIIKTNCGHIFCIDCFDKLNDNKKPYTKITCALCRSHIDKINYFL